MRKKITPKFIAGLFNLSIGQVVTFTINSPIIITETEFVYCYTVTVKIEGVDIDSKIIKLKIEQIHPSCDNLNEEDLLRDTIIKLVTSTVLISKNYYKIMECLKSYSITLLMRETIVNIKI